ncbi:ngoPIIM [Symbiodinium sp. CCMP2592]|nr:ngoPIIM [Symbiodinium sp. CCMP2592]
MASSLTLLLRTILQPLQFLERAVVVAEPCCGISGYRSLCSSVGVSWEPTAVYENDKGLAHFWRDCLGQQADQLNLGMHGDILKVDVASLQQEPEGLIAGPPCQPWAMCGLRPQQADPRCEVWEQTVEMIIHFAHRGSLMFFLLENSSAMMGSRFLDDTLERLRLCIPWFEIDFVKHDLGSVGPMHRERLWVRGLRKDCLSEDGKLPAVLRQPWETAGIQPPTLRSLLLPGKANDTTDSMTATQAANLQLYIQAVAEERRKHEFDLAVVELDRCPLRAVGGRVHKDRVPSLRTQGPLLFVLSTADIHLPSSQMEFHRYVLPEERLILQGHSPNLLQHFKSKQHVLQAAGNCFNFLQASIMLAPLLRAAVVAGKLWRGVRQPRLSRLELSSLCFAEVCDAPSTKPAVVSPPRKRQKMRATIEWALKTL